MDRLAPHIILTLGRSGSNTLVDILNQNPEVLNYGEVLGPWMSIRRYKFLIGGLSNRMEDYADHLLYDRKVARVANLARTLGKYRSGNKGDIKRFSGIRTLGFKEFSLNLQRFGLADHILSNPELRVIGLLRRSALDRLISGRRLQVTKQVLAREDSAAKEAFRIEFDPATLIEQLEIFQNEHDVLDAMIGRIPDARKYVIDYADLYSDPERTLKIAEEAYAFLGVTPMRPAVRMKKLIQSPMHDVISNYDSCRAVVADTQFAHYFP